MHGDDENRGFKGLGKLGANQPPPVPPAPGAGPSASGQTPPPTAGSPPPTPSTSETPPPAGGPHAGQTPPPGPGGSVPWTPPPKPGNSGCGKVVLVLLIGGVLLFGALLAIGWMFGKDAAETAVEAYEAADTAGVDPAQVAADAEAELARLQAEIDRLERCREGAGATPENGEVLVRELESGDHVLRINGGDTDGLIKLRRDGATVLSFYVRAHDTAAVEDIPDGTYELMFANGSDFSRGCGEFVTGMSVSADPDPVEFAPIVEDGVEYAAIVEYTLTRQVGGNFEPASVDPEQFRD